MFKIDDEAHSELQRGSFLSFAAAMDELARRAAIPWNEKSNRAPCRSWQTCQRKYSIVEYENGSTTTMLRRVAVP